MYYHPFYLADSFKPKSLEFDVWSSSDIKKLSVAKVNNCISFDNLEYPISGGLYDTRLGPIKFTSDPCATCGNNLMKCVGHFGHIELPLPVYNPVLVTAVANIVRISCLDCCTIRIPEVDKCVITTQLKLIDAGFFVEPSMLDEYLSELRNTIRPLDEVQDDMKKVCDRLSSNSSPKTLCKSTDEIWRSYINKIFRGRAAKNCVNCNVELPKITFSKSRLYVEEPSKAKEYLTPMAAKEHLRKLWSNDEELMKMLIKVLSDTNEEYPTDICFTTAVLVTPSNTRPVQVINSKQIEHPKNAMYRAILQDNMLIRAILQVMNEEKNGESADKELLALVKASRGQTINEKLNNAWMSLQQNVNALLDANALKGFINLSVGIPKIGLKQLIEKKVGILRKNMMGKRVDYFARSVITPDPLLNIYEIGLPETFAKKLTFPVPVTPWNVTELRQLVLNGPNVYPGANMVEMDDGAISWISGTNSENRKGLAKTLLTPKIDSSGPKVVHRHLVDGDMLLINRQPSLHKSSIMAHKARVLKGEKTFRLHYANCKAYNADFDGDEMNAHFPQGQLARAEALEIANVVHQYLVPRDGSPLSGLIQDHVISGFRLSIRDRFFERWQYHQLVFQALCFLKGDIKLLPPAILKPQRLWTGKQIISTIVINLIPDGYVPLNLNSKTKLAYNAWSMSNVECEYMTAEEREKMSETNFIIRRGELLCGVLDKNHVGATHYGLVHSFYELYGGQHSANLLSAFSKLFTFYLQKDGFTLGVADILVRDRPNRKRDKIARKVKMAGRVAAKNALDIPPEEEVDEEELRRRLEIAYKKNSNFRALMDREYKTILDQYTNDINKACLPGGLLRLFPNNNLQLMVQSGAKGSTVNTMQISCLLGQIELEGKRPPLMISGKSLPSFRPYDTSPMAGGFITSRFMTGIQPQEFFFHCMAGREGLIDTAVKTSRSGYLQRCLVKHLEGLVVNYDLTVRDSDNSVIQFRYGEDGLDISKSQLLKPAQLKFFTDNIDSLYDKSRMKALKANTAKSEIKRRKAAVSAFLSENESVFTKKSRDGPFLRFCSEVGDDLPSVPARKTKIGKNTPRSTSRTETATNLCRTWQEHVHDSIKIKYAEMCNKCPDPVTADYAPDAHFGSVSEKIENMLDDYLKTNEGNPSVKKSKFKDAIYWKSFSSLCHPGEAVGVLAAQSVGEPSTQMTLNTFHFAGRGEMNVTLGIPRLREILMAASKRIKTPTMEIPFKKDVPKLEKKAEKLRKGLTRVTLKNVLEKIDVRESIHPNENHIRKYRLKLHYLPRKCYSSTTNVKPRDILRYAETRFLVKLQAMLKKHLKSHYSSQLVTERKETTKGDVGETDDAKKKKDDDSDSDSDEEGDDDATKAKSRSRHVDDQEYDDEVDSENEDTSDEENDDENGNSKNMKPEETKNSEESDSDDEDDASFNLSKIKNETSSGKAFRSAKITKKYEIKRIEHDEVGMSWTKIELWTSLSYKRLDLSALLPREAETAVIHEVPGIKRAVTYFNNDGLLMLKTEGSYGIGELFKHDRLLDFNKLYSNDVQAVALTYGIEAANRVIVREVQNVFQVYGITVDPRHLLLIADYMTFSGAYLALNRVGMDSCPSPLQQMTFESTLKYLKNATVRKLKDNLQSPSSSLIIGKESKIGSGLISCIEPINLY